MPLYLGSKLISGDTEGVVKSSDESVSDIVTLTKAEYDQLDSQGKISNDTLYIISDDNTVDSASNIVFWDGIGTADSITANKTWQSIVDKSINEMVMVVSHGPEDTPANQTIFVIEKGYFQNKTEPITLVSATSNSTTSTQKDGHVEFCTLKYKTTVTLKDGNVADVTTLDKHKVTINYLSTDYHTRVFTPTEDAHPATKKYVDDSVSTFYWDGSSANAVPLWQSIHNTVKVKKYALVIAKTSGYEAFFIIRERDFERTSNEITSISQHATFNKGNLGDSQNVAGACLEELHYMTTIKMTNGEVSAVSDIAQVYIGHGTQWCFLPTNATSNNSFNPTKDCHPATKKYVDDAINNAIVSALNSSY